MALCPGDKFGRYLIEGVLGEGGMGQIYLALDPVLDRRVALKILRSDGAAPDSTRLNDDAAIVLREARAAAALDHPNAVAIYEIGEADRTPYIAMERIEGRALRTYVGEPSVPVEQRVRWLVEIGRALGAAHRRGLMHRDVKPENVMIRDDGVVKVLDFGIARHTQGPVDPTGSTARALADLGVTNSGAGTPLYMAPEQLRGEPLDGRTDQFAWGVLAYELLSGAPPWSTRDAVSLLTDILNKNPASLADRGTPAEVERTVRRALSKKSTDRFPSMADAIGSLERFALASLPSLPPDHDPLVPPSPSSATTKAPVASGRRDEARARAGLARAWWIAAAILMLGGGYLALHRPAAPAPAQPPPRRTIAVTDLQPPASQNAAALAAYAQAMQATRDGSAALYAKGLEDAVKLDPSIAAAHLRLAIDAVGWTLTDSRESFQNAAHQRGSLTARDQALLDAFEPFIEGDPADTTEWSRRVEALAARYPDDAEIHHFVSFCRLMRGDFRGALEVSERAITIDPSYGAAWARKGDVYAYLGDFAAAKAAFDKCLALSPSASSCLAERMAMNEQLGDCAAVERDARRTIAILPSGWLGYYSLARAQVALGQPIEAIQETLRLKWARLPPSAHFRQIADEVALHVLGGDFTAGERSVAQLVDAMSSVPDEMFHASVVRRSAEIFFEEGRVAEAGRVAQDFMRRRGAWGGGPLADDVALMRDPRPRLYAIEHHAGLLTNDQFTLERAAWIDEWRSKLVGDYAGYLWVHAYAAGIETPEEARDALLALSTSPPVPPYLPWTVSDEGIGRVYALAGDTARARPILERATANCRALDNPFEQTRAYYWLGEVLAGEGDTKGACRAFAVVRTRWGHAVPRSVTADRAKARMAALGCGGT